MLTVTTLLLLSSPVLAADCEPLDEADFRSMVLDAQAAVDHDDAALHVAIVDEIEARIPCMEFAPSPRSWADFLVNAALVEFGQGGDWQTPLAAAVRVRPSVDRGVGPGHPMGRWLPDQASPAEGEPVPEGVVLWVDGRLTNTLPPAQGLHLVQKEQDDLWSSQLLSDQPVDPEWLLTTLRPPREMRVTWSGHVNLGPAVTSQLAFDQATPDTFVDSDYVPTGGEPSINPGASFRALLRYGRVGSLLDVDLAWSDLGRNIGAGGHATVGLASSRGSLGIGVGLLGANTYTGARSFGEEDEVDSVQADEGIQDYQPPERTELIATTHTLSCAVLAGLLQHSGGKETGLALGLGGAGFRVDLHHGGPLVPKHSTAEGPWRWGLVFSWNVGTFGQQAFPDRLVVSSYARMAVEIGLGREMRL